MEDLQTVQDEICNGIEKNAIGYLKSGIGLFNSNKKHNVLFKDFQVIIGILGISVELMLKALIARECFPFLYKGLSTDLLLKLIYPEKITGNFQHHFLKLRTFNSKYNSIEFNEAIGIFYIMFPDKVKEFKPYFNSISEERNNSVHAYIPSFQKHDVDRFAYISLKLYDLLRTEKKMFNKYGYSVDTKFISQYDQERILRVKDKIKKSKDKLNNVNRIHKKEISSNLIDWDNIYINCPVCGSDAILNGETDFLDNGNESVYCWNLIFRGESFGCDCCGLSLDEYEELELAGIDTEVEISEHIEDYLCDVYYN